MKHEPTEEEMTSLEILPFEWADRHQKSKRMFALIEASYPRGHPLYVSMERLQTCVHQAIMQGHDLAKIDVVRRNGRFFFSAGDEEVHSLPEMESAFEQLVKQIGFTMVRDERWGKLYASWVLPHGKNQRYEQGAKIVYRVFFNVRFTDEPAAEARGYGSRKITEFFVPVAAAASDQ